MGGVAIVVVSLALLFIFSGSSEEKAPETTSATLPVAEPTVVADRAVPAATVQAATPIPTPTPVPIKLAPDFTLDRLDGSSITLADYRGEKPVILDFWASWCHNCQRDMPRLSKWYDQYGDQVEVIGVNLQEKPAVAQSYVDRANISFPIAMDPKSKVSRLYGISYTNTHILIKRDGSIDRVIPGDISEEDIQNLIAGS